MSAAIVTHDAVGEQDRRRWFALALIVAAQFMVVLDVAIVNVALPSIKTDLNFSQESLQWVITAYSIFFGGVLLLGGRLADLLGRRRLFIAGLALFTVSSLLDGFAWSSGSLIGFRALQGLGAALLSPAALSILTTTFREGRERNLALGVDDRPSHRVRGADRRLLRDRDPIQGAAPAASHLPAAHALGLEPQRSSDGRCDLLAVLPPHPVHAGSAPLLRAQDRPGLR